MLRLVMENEKSLMLQRAILIYVQFRSNEV